jgi:hypothetical protein
MAMIATSQRQHHKPLDTLRAKTLTIREYPLPSNLLRQMGLDTLLPWCYLNLMGIEVLAASRQRLVQRQW